MGHQLSILLMLFQFTARTPNLESFLCLLLRPLKQRQGGQIIVGAVSTSRKNFEEKFTFNTQKSSWDYRNCPSLHRKVVAVSGTTSAATSRIYLLCPRIQGLWSGSSQGSALRVTTHTQRELSQFYLSVDTLEYVNHFSNNIVETFPRAEIREYSTRYTRYDAQSRIQILEKLSTSRIAENKCRLQYKRFPYTVSCLSDFRENLFY